MVTKYLLYMRQGYVDSREASMWVDCYVLHRAICRKLAKDECVKEPSDAL